MRRPEYVLAVVCDDVSHGRGKVARITTLSRVRAPQGYSWVQFDPERPGWEPEGVRAHVPIPIADPAVTQVVAEERWSMRCPLCGFTVTRRDKVGRDATLGAALDRVEDAMTDAGHAERAVVTLRALGAILDTLDRG